MNTLLSKLLLAALPDRSLSRRWSIREPRSLSLLGYGPSCRPGLGWLQGLSKVLIGTRSSGPSLAPFFGTKSPCISNLFFEVSSGYNNREAAMMWTYLFSQFTLRGAPVMVRTATLSQFLEDRFQSKKTQLQIAGLFFPVWLRDMPSMIVLSSPCGNSGDRGTHNDGIATVCGRVRNSSLECKAF